jgi:hypothetical protein
VPRPFASLGVTSLTCFVKVSRHAGNSPAIRCSLLPPASSAVVQRRSSRTRSSLDTRGGPASGIINITETAQRRENRRLAQAEILLNEPPPFAVSKSHSEVRPTQTMWWQFRVIIENEVPIQAIVFRSMTSCPVNELDVCASIRARPFP